MADYFLKIDTVPGESLDDRHRDEIEVLSYSWGETNAGSVSVGGGAAVGKVHIEDFHFTALTSKASPKLMQLCANGKHLATAVFVRRKPGMARQEYLTFTFSNVTVSSYHVGGSTDDVPIDEVSLAFAKVQMDYKPQKVDGSLAAAIHAGWDVKLNKAV
jgi:type VI secretion system secreted protein Hcp